MTSKNLKDELGRRLLICDPGLILQKRETAGNTIRQYKKQNLQMIFEQQKNNTITTQAKDPNS